VEEGVLQKDVLLVFVMVFIAILALGYMMRH
jgi:hypothetical protein